MTVDRSDPNLQDTIGRFDSPVGTIHIAERAGLLTRIQLLGTALAEPGPPPTHDVLCRARDQLLAYLEGERVEFALPLAPAPSSFLAAVRRHMMAIPRGGTATYGDLAHRLGDPGAVRAIGQACGSNPLPLVVPCHRVVAARDLGGFGYGLPCKRWLLRLEGALAQGDLFESSAPPPIQIWRAQQRA